MKSLEARIKERERSRRYAATHKEERKEYREGRKEEKALQDHIHYVENKPMLRAQQDQYRIEHKDERRLYQDQYDQDHWFTRAEYMHDRYLKRTKEVAKYSHEHYLRDKVRIRARVDKYFKEHPEVRKLNHLRRRTLELGAIGQFTLEEFEAKCEAYGNACAYCGCELPLEIEHMTPLTKNGDNYISNILPACKSCNCSKHTKTFEEFLALHTQEEQEEILTRVYLAEHLEDVAMINERLREKLNVQTA